MRSLNDIKVSVVVVCYNEKGNIAHCLDSLLAQTTDRSLYEIIVVDNISTDGTREIIALYTAKYDSIKLVSNPVKGIAGSRNMGINASKYDYIAYTDADCVAPAEWLEILRTGFLMHSNKEPALAAVGGANIPPQGVNSFYDALKITLNTFLGNHGSTQGKIYENDTEVDHIPTVNILYDKNILTKYGCFDESYGSICEDPELNFRLIKAGYRIVFLKNSYVLHYMKTGLFNWARKMFTYGKGRVWIIDKHPDHFRLMYLIPPMFAVSLLLTPLSLHNPWFLAPLLYFPVVFFISIFTAFKSKNMALAVKISLIYFICHFFYGIGGLYGLFKKRAKAVLRNA